jgi:phage terminase small subunit
MAPGNYRGRRIGKAWNEHRQLQYIKNLAKGNTRHDAAKRAGYSEKMAQNAKLIEQSIVKRPEARELLQRALQKKREKIVRVLDEAMDATRTVQVAVIDASSEDESRELITEPDHRVRVQAAQVAAKLGNLEPEQINTSQGNVFNTQINIESMSSDERQLLMRKLAEELGVDLKMLLGAGV